MIRIVIQQLPLPAPQRVRVAGTPEPLCQRQGHRNLAAVQAQPRALPPQDQPQVLFQNRSAFCFFTGLLC